MPNSESGFRATFVTWFVRELNTLTISTEPTVPQGDGFFRWAIAVALTFVLLPFPIARVLVGWKIQYQSVPAIIAIVAGLLLIPLFTVGLADHWKPRSRRLLAFVLTCVWLGMSCGITFLRASDSTPWYVIGPLLGASSLWALWLTWMHAFPRGLFFKAVVFLLLAAWGGGFWHVFDIAGMAGDARLDFVLKRDEQPLDSTTKTTTAAETDRLQLADDAFCSYLGGSGGVLTGRKLASDWQSVPPVELWRREVGKGWSGFVANDQFAWTQESRGAAECVVCYSLETGDEVWLHSNNAVFESVMAGDGPRATPTLCETKNDDGSVATRIVTVGATGIVNCLNAATGKRIWEIDLLSEYSAENLVHGVCASPLVHDGIVYVCPPGADGPFLAAYQLSDGQFLWKAGDKRLSYSSPMLATLCDTQQILLHAGPGVYSFAAQSGKQLWFVPWTNEHDNNAAQPIVHVGVRDRVFASTGYGRGSTVFAVQKTGSGWTTKTIWEQRNLKTKYCTPIQFQGEVYGLDDGILSCVDAESGKRLWKRGRYGHGQILLVDGHLLIQCEQGDLALVQPDRKKHIELARLPMLNGKTWNTLCLTGSRLLIRNDHEAVCLQLPTVESNAP